MTTLAPSEASNKSVGLSDLERVERELRLRGKGYSTLIAEANVVAAYIAAQKERDLVANLSAELSRVTQKGHANG